MTLINNKYEKSINMGLNWAFLSRKCPIISQSSTKCRSYSLETTEYIEMEITESRFYLVWSHSFGWSHWRMWCSKTTPESQHVLWSSEGCFEEPAPPHWYPDATWAARWVTGQLWHLPRPVSLITETSSPITARSHHPACLWARALCQPLR